MLQRCCPHCGQTIPEIRCGVRLGPVAARIVDAVQRAGVDGIAPADLFALIYGDKPGRKRNALSGYISWINHAFAGLTPMRIVMRQGSYRIGMQPLRKVARS